MQQSVGTGSLLWMPFRCDNALETLSWVGDDDDDKKKNITELVEVVPAVCVCVLTVSSGLKTLANNRIPIPGRGVAHLDLITITCYLNL